LAASFDKQNNFGANQSNQRIPETLQTVLVVANRGKDVVAPPPGGVAFKMFGRRSSIDRKSSSQSSGILKSLFGDSSHSSSNNEKPLRSSLRQSRRSSSSTMDTQTTDSESPIGSPRRRRSSQKKVSSSDLPLFEVIAGEPETKHHVSPQAYFDSMVKTRGYSAATFLSLETAYHNKPTPIQVASHGVKLSESIRSNNLEALRRFLDAGLSPNACNEFGESIVHMVCRLGHAECLKVLLEHGCIVQVCDDYGRNPLHDACWATNVNFECVNLLLEQDRHLLCLKDRRGATPLTYLKEDQWTAWTKFLMSKKDKYWPERDIVKLGMEPDPELVSKTPNTRPIPAPENNIAIELAKMVSTGRMTAMEAILMMDDDDDDDEEDNSEGSEEDDFDGYDSDAFSDSTFDETEMQAVLGSLCCFGKGKAVAWSSK